MGSGWSVTGAEAAVQASLRSYMISQLPCGHLALAVARPSLGVIPFISVGDSKMARTCDFALRPEKRARGTLMISVGKLVMATGEHADNGQTMKLR